MRFPIGCIPLLLFIFMGTSQVSAEVSTQRFDLPKQSLQNALIEFGLQAKVTLLVDQELIQGQTMTPVKGAFSIDNALKQLLSKTDLDFTYLQKSNAYLLVRRPTKTEASATSITEIFPAQPSIEEINVVGRLNYPLRYNTVTNTQLHSGMSYFDSARFLNVTIFELLNRQFKLFHF